MTDNNLHTSCSSNFPPSDWVETTLGEVVEIVIDNRGKNPSYYTEQGIPVIDNILIKENRKIDLTEARRFIDDELYNKFIRKHGESGDVIITLVGNGYGNIALFPDEKSVIIQNTIGLRVNSKSYNLFLYYLLKNDKKKILDLNIGAAQPSVKVGDLLNIKFLLPPLPEQQAIASVLSAFDDKIELLREQNKTLEEMGQVIFQEWFGKYGVDDELPEGWRVGKIKDIVDIFDSQRIPLSSNQRQEKQGKYPYHGATSIMDYVDEYLFDGIYLLLAEDGSVMDQNGYPVLQYVWDKFWVNNHAHVLQGANDFSTEMLYLLFKNTKIAGIVNGAVQLKINQTNLMNLEVIIPDQETLKQFDEAIQPIFGKIRDNSEQIQPLARSRDELLPKLMRGEVRVNDF